MRTAPPIPVLPLVRNPGRDWLGIHRVFRQRPKIALGQSWLAAPEPRFRPGFVRLGLTGMNLAVLAVLEDRDVFNPVTRFNVPAFPHGDTFEIFLKPDGQDAYWEFHITPGNTLLQLRYPEPLRTMIPQIEWESPGDPLQQLKVTRWRVASQVRTHGKGWEVFVEIPLERLFEAGAPWSGSVLRASFARYDHTRGRLRPVLSSTSNHPVPDFHRQDEWTALELAFTPR